MATKTVGIMDSRRTVSCAVKDGLVHRIVSESRWGYKTRCGLTVEQGDLTMLKQRPEDITCPKCAEKKERKQR